MTNLLLVIANGESESGQGVVRAGGVLPQDGLNLLGAATQPHQFTREVHALFHQRKVLILRKHRVTSYCWFGVALHGGNMMNQTYLQMLNLSA